MGPLAAGARAPGHVVIDPYRSTRFADVGLELVDEAVKNALLQFRDDHPGTVMSSTARIAEDRDRPGTYVSIVEFASYEEAMKQSQNPATGEFSQKLAQLMSGPPRFRNLDVRAVLVN